MTARVVYTQEQIRNRLEDIARDIENDFTQEEICVVGLLEDSFVFMADLIRKVNREVLCYFMKADVDEGEDRVASIKRILCSPELDARDRSILLIGGSILGSLWITSRNTFFRVVHDNSRSHTWWTSLSRGALVRVQTIVPSRCKG